MVSIVWFSIRLLLGSSSNFKYDKDVNFYYIKYFTQHMNIVNTWLFLYSTHEFSFIIFIVFPIGMRPNQSPYDANYMDSIQHMYIIALKNNQSSTKVHHTTA